MCVYNFTHTQGVGVVSKAPSRLPACFLQLCFLFVLHFPLLILSILPPSLFPLSLPWPIPYTTQAWLRLCWRRHRYDDWTLFRSVIDRFALYMQPTRMRPSQGVERRCRQALRLSGRDSVGHPLSWKTVRRRKGGEGKHGEEEREEGNGRKELLREGRGERGQWWRGEKEMEEF